MKSLKKTTISSSEEKNVQNGLNKPEQEINQKKTPTPYADDEEFDITLDDDLELFNDLDEDDDDDDNF